MCIRDRFYLETDNSTCDVIISVGIYGQAHDGSSFQDGFQFRGPCQMPPSPFTLTYDGVEHEMDYEFMEYDDCTDMDGHWECEYGYDWDGDGQVDEYGYDEYEYGDCEWSETDMVWYCIVGAQPPQIEEGNHTMELLVEGLEVGDDYSVEMDAYVCDINNECDWADLVSMHYFTATAENETVVFYVETDNYTCDLNISVGIFAQAQDGSSFKDGFHFRYRYGVMITKIQLAVFADNANPCDFKASIFCGCDQCGAFGSADNKSCLILAKCPGMQLV